MSLFDPGEAMFSPMTLKLLKKGWAGVFRPQGLKLIFDQIIDFGGLVPKSDTFGAIDIIRSGDFDTIDSSGRAHVRLVIGRSSDDAGFVAATFRVDVVPELSALVLLGIGGPVLLRVVSRRAGDWRHAGR